MRKCPWCKKYVAPTKFVKDAGTVVCPNCNQHFHRNGCKGFIWQCKDKDCGKIIKVKEGSIKTYYPKRFKRPLTVLRINDSNDLLEICVDKESKLDYSLYLNNTYLGRSNKPTIQYVMSSVRKNIHVAIENISSCYLSLMCSFALMNRLCKEEYIPKELTAHLKSLIVGVYHNSVTTVYIEEIKLPYLGK